MDENVNFYLDKLEESLQGNPYRYSFAVVDVNYVKARHSAEHMFVAKKGAQI